MKLIVKIFLIFFLINATSFSQAYSVGGGIGIGSFNGNFPSQTTFGTKLFLDIPSPISLFNKLQFHFTYAQKIQKVLPGNYNYDYYSYHTNFGISGIFFQKLSDYFNIEEGVGIIYLNDRSFENINSWNYGILINFGINTSLSNDIKLFANLDYGITLNNTTVNYVLITFGIKYRI